MIEKMFKEFGIKTKIVCTSPDGKCQEDFNGLCYYCGRNMIDSDENKEIGGNKDGRKGFKSYC